MTECRCQRCDRPCKTAEKSEPGALLIRKSVVPKGCCVDCAITCFMKTGFLAEVLPGGPWCAPGFDIATVIRLPHVQEQFGRVLKAARCIDAAAEINWERVIDNWYLPIPGKDWDWGGEIYQFAGKKRR